jgi:hypothetical protein
MAIVETFYFFDDAAAATGTRATCACDNEDPDNLKAHFDAVVTTTEPAAHEAKP